MKEQRRWRACLVGDLPVASSLCEMDAVGADWILATGDNWRLYVADHPARTTSFLKLDLSKLAERPTTLSFFQPSAIAIAGIGASFCARAPRPLVRPSLHQPSQWRHHDPRADKPGEDVREVKTPEKEKGMGKLVVTEFVSVDGAFQEPSGAGATRSLAKR